MTAVSVETPLAPAFSEDMAQTTLAKHLNNQVLTPLLWAFCANDLAESEHQLLLNNESLVVRQANFGGQGRFHQKGIPFLFSPSVAIPSALCHPSYR